MGSRTKLEIFLFVPNIIGYIRLVLITFSWIYIENPEYFLPVYGLSVLLDGVDGWAARKLNQISDYGACLDVVVDLLGRGMVWTNVHKYGYAIVAFEWLVFVGNNERASGSQWKKSFELSPSFVKLVMKDGFKTPLGLLTILGLHLLPTWMYALKYNSVAFLPLWVMDSFTLVLILGRCVCATVEFWCCWNYLQLLLLKSPCSE